MSAEDKVRAYNRYQAAPTVGTKQGLPDPLAVHPDFVTFVNGWEPTDEDDVNTAHLGDTSFGEVEFYKQLMSHLFHVNWSKNNPGEKGSGNVLMVELQYDPSDKCYIIRHVGLTEPNQLIVLKNPTYLLHSNSIQFEDGVVKVLFKYTTRSVDGVRLWNYQVAINDRLKWNYYLAPISL